MALLCYELSFNFPFHLEKKLKAVAVAPAASRTLGALILFYPH